MNLSATSAEKALLLVLTASLLVLMLSSGALAQSVPPASQYESGQGARSCPAGTASVQPDTDAAPAGNQALFSVGDGPCAAADNVGQGTAAVNDALTGTASPASAASAPGEAPVPPKDVASKSIEPEPASDKTSVSPKGTASGSGADEDETATKDKSADGGTAKAEEGLASVTELPKTGGGPPVMLLAGVLLVTLGLAVRRIF